MHVHCLAVHRDLLPPHLLLTAIPPYSPFILFHIPPALQQCHLTLLAHSSIFLQPYSNATLLSLHTLPYSSSPTAMPPYSPCTLFHIPPALQQCHLTLLAHSSIFLQPYINATLLSLHTLPYSSSPTAMPPYSPCTLFHIPPALQQCHLTLLAHSSIFLQPYSNATLLSLHTLPYSSSPTAMPPYSPCTLFHIPPALQQCHLTLLAHSSIFLQPYSNATLLSLYTLPYSTSPTAMPPYSPCTLFHIPPALQQCHLTLLAHSSIFLQPYSNATLLSLHTLPYSSSPTAMPPYSPCTLFHIPPALQQCHLTLLAHSSIFLQPYSNATLLSLHTFPYSSSPTAMPPYSLCTLFHIPPALQQCHLTLLAHSSMFLQPLQFCSPHLPVPTDPSQIPHTSPINAPNLPLHHSHTLHTSSINQFASLLILRQPGCGSSQCE